MKKPFDRNDNLTAPRYQPKLAKLPDLPTPQLQQGISQHAKNVAKLIQAQTSELVKDSRVK